MTEESFTRAAERYADTVFRVAYSQTRSHADADDVTQDVLLQLLQTDRGFESDEHLRRWLIRVTVNRCRMLFRAPWRKTESIEDYAETLGFEAPEYTDLFTAVMRLDKKYRAAVYLYYYEGYTAPEIAGLLGVSANTVSTRLRRAREKLRKDLTEVEDHD